MNWGKINGERIKAEIKVKQNENHFSSYSNSAWIPIERGFRKTSRLELPVLSFLPRKGCYDGKLRGFGIPSFRQIQLLRTSSFLMDVLLNPVKSSLPKIQNLHCFQLQNYKIHSKN